MRWTCGDSKEMSQGWRTVLEPTDEPEFKEELGQAPVGHFYGMSVFVTKLAVSSLRPYTHIRGHPLVPTVTMLRLQYVDHLPEPLVRPRLTSRPKQDFPTRSSSPTLIRASSSELSLPRGSVQTEDLPRHSNATGMDHEWKPNPDSSRYPGGADPSRFYPGVRGHGVHVLKASAVDHARVRYCAGSWWVPPHGAAVAPCLHVPSYGIRWCYASGLPAGISTWIFWRVSTWIPAGHAAPPLRHSRSLGLSG